MIALGLTGSAAVGKTTILNKVAEALDLHPIPSITRTYYAEMGVKDESESYSAGLGKFLAFQEGLLIRHNNWIESQIQEASRLGKRGFISDRTALDHVAFTMQRNQELPLRWILKHENILVKELNRYDHVFFLAYPAVFSPLDNEKTDDFRYDPAAKNYTITALIEYLWNRISNPRYVKKQIVDPEDDDDDMFELLPMVGVPDGFVSMTAVDNSNIWHNVPSTLSPEDRAQYIVDIANL
jgi:hypothetical protein